MEYKFITVDDPHAGSMGDYTTAINDAGIITGNYQDSLGVSHGFDYTGKLTKINPSKFTTIDEPNAGSGGTTLAGINNHDWIVGGYYDLSGQRHGFIYTGKLTKINPSKCVTINDPNASFLGGAHNNGTYVHGINNHGTIVGYYVDATGKDHGFIYSGNLAHIDESKFKTIDDPKAGVKGTLAYGINDSGVVVGVYFDVNGVMNGFIEKGGHFKTVNDPNGFLRTSTDGLNNHNEIVGGYNT